MAIFQQQQHTHTHIRYGMKLVANKLLPSFKHFPWLYATNNKSWLSKWYVKSWNIFVSTDNSSCAVSLPLLPWCNHSKQFRNLWMHAFKSFLTFWWKLCGWSKFPHKIYTYTSIHHACEIFWMHPYLTIVTWMTSCWTFLGFQFCHLSQCSIKYDTYIDINIEH